MLQRACPQAESTSKQSAVQAGEEDDIPDVISDDPNALVRAVLSVPEAAAVALWLVFLATGAGNAAAKSPEVADEELVCEAVWVCGAGG